MQARDLTAVALAEQSGVSRPTISEILNEKSDAEDETLDRLSRALDTPLPTITVRLRKTAVVTRPGTPGSIEEAGQGTAEEAGWLFGDPSGAAEQFRLLIRNIERTHRGMISDPEGFPAVEVRQLQLAAVRASMLQCELAGKPVPEFVHQVYNELIEGRFT